MKTARRRELVSLTPAQKRRLQKARRAVAAELPDLIRRNQIAHDATKEKTFSALLRKAIHQSRTLLPDLAARCELDMRDLADFLTGAKTLPSDAIDRLVKELKLRLSPGRPRRTATTG